MDPERVLIECRPVPHPANDARSAIGTGKAMVLQGSTDGISLSGAFKISTAIFVNPVSFFVIPIGMYAAVRLTRLAGQPATVVVQYSHGDTDASGQQIWINVSSPYVLNKGEPPVLAQSPLILHSFRGGEAFQVWWTQETAGATSIELELQFKSR